MPTAIIRIRTNDGMVVAADGLERKHIHGPITSAHLQKIYPITDAPAVYAIFGSTGMRIGGDNPDSIDLLEEARKSESLISYSDCADLYQYAEKFSEPIQDRLSSWRTDETVLFPGNEEPPNPGNTIAHFFFFGYHHGKASNCDLRFFHRNHVLQKPSIESLDTDIGHPPLTYGSKKVAQSLFKLNDEKFSLFRKPFPPDITIDDAVGIAVNYILACTSTVGREIDPITCFTIGGHIHVAKITPRDGFQWIIPPHKDE